MRPRCAHFGSNRFGAQRKGPQCGHSVPTMRSLCTHYVLKPLSGSTYMPTVGSLGAPPIRPPRLSTVLGFKRRAHSGVAMCPRCARYAPTMSSSRFGVQSMGPQSGHYAPTMRPLCAHVGLQPVWASIEGPAVGPLCAHYALAMHPLCLHAALGFNL